MKNYAKNVRADLKDREIHVPEKVKFHEPATNVENPVINDPVIRIFYIIFYLISICLMIISILSMKNNWDSSAILCMSTTVTCVLCLMGSSMLYGFKYSTFLWIMNTVLWTAITANELI